MTALIENSTPQHTPGFTRVGRRRQARLSGRAHLRAVQAHLATGAARPRAADFLAEANRQEGKPYNAAIGCRCSDTCPEQDCSGLVCGARNVVAQPLGFPPMCTSSFGLAVMCRDAGRLITEEQAIWTPGSIGIVNPWGSPNGPLGSNGHVFIMEGDGKLTIEEMGTAYGCRHGNATGRGASAWAELVDLDYSPPPAPAIGEPMLFLDNQHAAPHPSRTRSASVQPNGVIWLGNGAHLDNGTVVPVLGIRTVTPPSGGATFLGAGPRGPNGFVLQFLQKDGSFADFAYQFAA